MSSSKKKTGFSLIELMVVVAIIGVLATIGVPAYSNYIARARVSELLAGVAPVKSSANEQMSINGSQTCTAVPASTALTSNSTYAVAANCTITVTGAAAPSPLAGLSATFTPTYSSGIISWGCAGAGPNAATIFPSTCPGANPAP